MAETMEQTTPKVDHPASTPASRLALHVSAAKPRPRIGQKMHTDGGQKMTTKTTAAARAHEGPIVDLTSMLYADSTAHDDALRGKVYSALGNLLGSKPSVRQALEMKWILLLIITTMRTLSEPVATDKHTWREDILELAENGGGLRQHTGGIVAAFFETAPWGLQKQAGSSSFDTVRSVNAITAGVVGFARQLAAELKQVEEGGVILKDFDVEEAGTDDEEVEQVMKGKKRARSSPKRSKQQTSTPSEASGSKRTKRTPGNAGHGNHQHGRSIPWTTPEYIGLLELYRDHPDRRLIGHQRIAELHNARFWPKFGEGRSNAAVSQQYLKLVQHDVSLIPAKLAELQALLDENA